jgi:hypothetical protein
MIIKKIAVGNSHEAYIENKLTEELNVISSDDNNKGKTIIIQSLMYCLGSEPVFPSSFKFEEYYFIVEFEFNSTTYTISRKKDSFVLYVEKSILMFDNVSELKRYWTKKIFQFPEIQKNGLKRIVDPDLFNQIFFVGQDKKDSSNISNKGFYTKKDFYNVIYSFVGLGEKSLSSEKVSLEKAKLKKLKEEKKILLQKNKILSSEYESIAFISKHSDRVAFENKIKQIENIKDSLVMLKNERNRTLNKRLKYQNTLKELNSLNRTISTGELQCLDCYSTHVGYTSGIKKSFTFDVSTKEVRSQIIESISEKIDSYTEELEKQTNEINIYQQKLQELLTDEDISLESIILYKEDTININKIESKLDSLENQISEISSSINESKLNIEETGDKQNSLVKEILKVMNNIYKQIDPNGNLVFDDIFTKKSEVFSGSEATEFHLAKIYALAKVLKHPYPIVIDSFRAEDLSTDREQTVVDLFNQLDNQVIFTTTLKKEEIGKYNEISGINHIDYSYHMPSKILKKEYVSEFARLTQKLMINVLN